MINTVEVGRMVGALAEIGADYSAHRDRVIHELLRNYRDRANKELAVFAAHQLEGDGARRIDRTREVLFEIYQEAVAAAEKFDASSLRDVAAIASDGLVAEELT